MTCSKEEVMHSGRRNVSKTESNGRHSSQQAIVNKWRHRAIDPCEVHRDGAEPYGSARTTADLRQKVRNVRTIQDMFSQFLRTAVCRTAYNVRTVGLYMCSDIADTCGTVLYNRELSERAIRGEIIIIIIIKSERHDNVIV